MEIIMASGGIRANAGRKKIGIVVNARIDEQIIEQIDRHIQGLSRADRIRQCLLLGIEHKKNILDSAHVESNASTIAKFYKTYQKLLNSLDGSDNDKVRIINYYLLGFFTSSGCIANVTLDKNTHNFILRELDRYEWSIDEYDDSPNLITAGIVGSVIEKVVNQKDTGSYYTPRDTTNYITQYSVMFSLLNKINMSSLTYAFYSKYGNVSNLDVINSSYNPVEKFADAINSLSDDERYEAFNSITNFTILDPTCGTGAFIIAAADILVKLYKLTNMYQYISLNDFVVNLFRNCLFGVDIMDCAISLINLRCKLYLYHLGISKSIVETLSFNFVCGDALTSQKKRSVGTFIWREQFPKVFAEGGFDCIIGNPPYVETTKCSAEIESDCFATKKCGNIYAFVVERSLCLLKENGYMGMVVPISLTSTQRMEPLREILYNNCEHMFIANFSDRPACLFTGVHQKLSIVFVKKGKSHNGCKIYSSTYKHWSKNERRFLFQSVKYYRTTRTLIDEYGIAKTGDEIKTRILHKIKELPLDFSDLLAKEENSNNIYINQRMTFWAKCFSSPEPSREYKKYSFRENINNKAIAALLNSSLFYLLWESYSDCWHVTQRDLNNLRFDTIFLDSRTQAKLGQLEDRLEKKLYKTREFIYSKQTDYIYVHRKCFDEITAINQLISEIYGFSVEETNYIQQYNSKYRTSTSKAAEEI